MNAAELADEVESWVRVTTPDDNRLLMLKRVLSFLRAVGTMEAAWAAILASAPEEARETIVQRASEAAAMQPCMTDARFAEEAARRGYSLAAPKTINVVCNICGAPWTTGHTCAPDFKLEPW